jgi:hypothetical protein
MGVYAARCAGNSQVSERGMSPVLIKHSSIKTKLTKIHSKSEIRWNASNACLHLSCYYSQFTMPVLANDAYAVRRPPHVFSRAVRQIVFGGAGAVSECRISRIMTTKMTAAGRD